MRIAIDARPLQNASAGRGVGRYVRSLIEYLPREGEEYWFIESRWAAAGRWPHGAQGRRVRLIRPSRAITLFDQAATPLLCAWRRIDLFHSTFYALPRLGGGRTAKVITVHDLIPLMVRGATSAKNTAIFNQIYRSARAADAVIVPSERTAADLIAHVAVPEERIRIIPMGVGAPFLRAEPALEAQLAPAPVTRSGPEPATGSASALGRVPASRISERFAALRASHARVVIYNGGFDATKNVPFLIEAAGHVRDVPLALCLTGDPGDALQGLEAAAERFGMAGRMLVLGRLEDGELAEAYRAADLFVSASSYEGFGLPPLEAMGCGCPVVALTSGAVPEVLSGAALGVEGGDPERLAAAIRRGLTDEALRKDLIAAGLARAGELSWRRTAAATHALYHELAGGV